MARSVPYRIVEGPDEAVMVELGGRRLSIVEISAQILKYLRQMAEEALGKREGVTDGAQACRRILRCGIHLQRADVHGHPQLGPRLAIGVTRFFGEQTLDGERGLHRP